MNLIKNYLIQVNQGKAAVNYCNLFKDLDFVFTPIISTNCFNSPILPIDI